MSVMCSVRESSRVRIGSRATLRRAWPCSIIYKLARYRIRPYFLMFFLLHTRPRDSAQSRECVLKICSALGRGPWRLSGVGATKVPSQGVHVPNVGTDRIVCGQYRPDLRSPCGGDHVSDARDTRRTSRAVPRSTT